MSTQRAVVHKSPGVAEVRDDVPLPSLKDGYITVKTKAVALNPTDWKSLGASKAPGTIAGCDYAGIVEQVGKGVTTLKPGDRVAGFVRGADPVELTGAFAQHIIAKSGILAKLTGDIFFEDAATLGVGITTVAQGLYQSLGLPLPPAKVQEPTSILIYGASTATGSLAVQFAKLSGLEVFATASPHNFDFVKSLGADQVFDYRDQDIGAKIRSASKDNLRLVFDTIGEKGAPEIAAAALSSKGGHYSSIVGVKEFPRADVTNRYTMAYTALGEKFNDAFPASQEDFEFGVKFWRIAEELINSGKLKPHPADVRGGLDEIPKGLQDLKDNQVSGVKLVYKIE
ncbi:chaperonin 10-like protein [Massariosphaeria phaeospora]|uniref:Chaperonin 10-like protein n=1 Tax=Massariosphaeria phaeospora TaxID=100035 RepID=A0A7C8I447_9PLEO|nr:chaperonin 10-like protein [Massariosphaeria phaeospora]